MLESWHAWKLSLGTFQTAPNCWPPPGKEKATNGEIWAFSTFARHGRWLVGCAKIDMKLVMTWLGVRPKNTNVTLRYIHQYYWWTSLKIDTYMYHGVMFLIPNSASPFNGITIQRERALFKEHVSCFTIAKYYKY